MTQDLWQAWDWSAHNGRSTRETHTWATKNKTINKENVKDTAFITTANKKSKEWTREQERGTTTKRTMKPLRTDSATGHTEGHGCEHRLLPTRQVRTNSPVEVLLISVQQ